MRDRRDAITVNIPFHPPYDWEGMLRFLKLHIVRDVEWVGDDFYARTVDIDGHRGWIHVALHETENALAVTLPERLRPVLDVVRERVAGLLDLAMDPGIVAAHLERLPLLAKAVRANPGLRVPGAFDGFELAARAILGQQITVKAAVTLSHRVSQRFGEAVDTPFPELTRLSPTAETLAASSVDDIASLGIIAARARSIIALAQATVDDPALLKHGGRDPEEAVRRLDALPGIGPWTAHYIAMRALRWQDAFPKEDIAIRKMLGGVSAKEVEALSAPMRPWRSYAVMHLWNMYLGFA